MSQGPEDTDLAPQHDFSGAVWGKYVERYPGKPKSVRSVVIALAVWFGAAGAWSLYSHLGSGGNHPGATRSIVVAGLARTDPSRP